ncbi:MAG: helix-turn-helix transcriptional regulator [Ruminiclostridium sp.]|nr:helix-turn-helix transcriptional regulator [Ruminiclostridium sp.]
MNIEIANRLYQLRKANNLSQEQLAEKVGVSRQAVSKWERAEASPDTDNLIILSKLYGISLDAMLFSEEKPESSFQAAEASITVSGQDEGFSQSEGNSAGNGWGQNGANHSWQANGTKAGCEGNSTNPGWEGNDANPGWEGNGANPGFQRSWGTEERKKVSKMMHAFPYPVFLTMIYLFIGFVLGLWHPGWLIYLTVPMYYMLADAIGKT